MLKWIIVRLKIRDDPADNVLRIGHSDMSVKTN